MPSGRYCCCCSSRPAAWLWQDRRADFRLDGGWLMAVAALAAVLLALLSLVVGLWLLWQRQGLQLLNWVVAVAGTGLWVGFIKATMQRTRPLDGLVHEAGFSFPCGHSAGTAAIFGMLAWLVARRLSPRWRAGVFAVAVLLALSTGLSRVLLSVHHASDVMAGLCLGLGWTALLLWLTDRVEHGDGAIAPPQAKAQLPLR